MPPLRLKLAIPLKGLRADRMDNKLLLKTGIIGAVVATMLCATPLLLILVAAIGLSSWLVWFDYLAFAALIFFAGITGYALLLYYRRKKPTKMELHCTLTCPHCNHREAEIMPTNACQFFYDCKGCGEKLRPNAGDCCVFCSFGTIPCPPIQEARANGAKSACGEGI